jgi:hypothetical protein
MVATVTPAAQVAGVAMASLPMLITLFQAQVQPGMVHNTAMINSTNTHPMLTEYLAQDLDQTVAVLWAAAQCAVCSQVVVAYLLKHTVVDAAVVDGVQVVWYT